MEAPLYVNLVRELHHDLLEHGLKLVATETDPWKLVLFVRNLRLFNDLVRLVLCEEYLPTTGPEELLARLTIQGKVDRQVSFAQGARLHDSVGAGTFGPSGHPLSD
jgi:hypothetical protein